MTKEDLLQIISSNITDNNNGDITAEILRDTLNSMVGYISEMENVNLDGCTYISTATPLTTPITLTGDEKVFYIVTEEGDYTNFGFGNISELSVIKSDNGYWEAESLGIPFVSSGGGNGDILTYVVSRKDSKTIRYGNNLLTGYGSGNGWTNNNGTYTHTSGYTDPLVFDYETIPDKKYLVKLQTGIVSLKEDDVNVSIGDGELCDIYRDTTGPNYVGIISKGGKLKITPSSTYTSTVYNVELYEISEDGVNSIIYSSLNVDGETMTSNITSFWNVAIGGDNALQKLQNGSRNVAIGKNAMINMESGERNVGIGTFALNQLKGGSRNIAIGADALYRTQHADRNVAIGKAALGYTHSDPGEHVYENNTVMGDSAMSGNAANYRHNTVIGKDAAKGFNSKDRNNIVAVGVESAYYDNENTVAVGYKAGRYSRGSNNVFVGASTGDITETGESNVIIGHGAKIRSGEGTWDNQATHNRSIVIGADAVATGSNQIVIGHPTHQNVCIIMGKKLIFNDDGTVTWESVL